MQAVSSGSEHLVESGSAGKHHTELAAMSRHVEPPKKMTIDVEALQKVGSDFGHGCVVNLFVFSSLI